MSRCKVPSWFALSDVTKLNAQEAAASEFRVEEDENGEDAAKQANIWPIASAAPQSVPSQPARKARPNFLHFILPYPARDAEIVAAAYCGLTAHSLGNHDIGFPKLSHRATILWSKGYDDFQQRQ
jgi:hypothetical protein